MTTAIGAFWKLRKQRELAITLQEKQEKAQKELETYKNELKQQNEKIKHLNEMRMANYTLFAQKKNEACIALFEALNQALECLASSVSLFHQYNTFRDLKVIYENNSEPRLVQDFTGYVDKDVEELIMRAQESAQSLYDRSSKS